MHRLGRHGLGFAAGIAVGVTATLAVVALTGHGSTHKGKRVYTLREGDVLRAPAAATRCIASQEGGFRNLFCSRSPEGRYQVVFYKDSFLVWRVGNPDQPAFSAKWEP